MAMLDVPKSLIIAVCNYLKHKMVVWGAPRPTQLYLTNVHSAIRLQGWVVLKTSGWAAHCVAHPDPKKRYLLGATQG